MKNFSEIAQQIGTHIYTILHHQIIVKIWRHSPFNAFLISVNQQTYPFKAKPCMKLHSGSCKNIRNFIGESSLKVFCPVTWPGFFGRLELKTTACNFEK